ncbi:V-type proton ATPase 16 kDa proteolipid subunit [Triticum urartu]|nr:V-type proton ATPase 16 kDa proteolipid subunit [Triticum urartu]
MKRARRVLCRGGVGGMAVCSWLCGSWRDHDFSAMMVRWCGGGGLANLDVVAPIWRAGMEVQGDPEEIPAREAATASVGVVPLLGGSAKALKGGWCVDEGSSPGVGVVFGDQIVEAQAKSQSDNRKARALAWVVERADPDPSSSTRRRKMSSVFSGDETAPFFGFLGAAAALVFSCMGAAYGTAKSGVGVASMGVMRPELVMKSIVPVVMAGVLGIYGLIIAVIISTGINPKAKPYYLFDGYAHLSSGLACGLAGLAAGMAIGIVGDAGVRANAQQPKLFVGMILILIFAEALALYGLIVGIILSSRAGQSRAD